MVKRLTSNDIAEQFEGPLACPPDDAFVDPRPNFDFDGRLAPVNPPPVDQGVAEMLAQPIQGSSPDYKTWIDRREKEAQLDAERATRLKTVLERDPALLALVVGVVFKPSHIQGGPCIDAAPEGEEFFPMEEGWQVTCPLCQTAMALCEGDQQLLGQEHVDPYAKAVADHHQSIYWNVTGKYPAAMSYNSVVAQVGSTRKR
jgi:hypothetical protein